MATEPTRLYEQFAPPERLTLLLEAMARDDAAEAQRLRRTCPRATYTGQDPAFEDRWTMAFDIMAVVCIDLRASWAKLHLLQWVIESVHPVATGHHVTASLAFVDGIRCGRGRSRLSSSPGRCRSRAGTTRTTSTSRTRTTRRRRKTTGK